MPKSPLSRTVTGVTIPMAAYINGCNRGTPVKSPRIPRRWLRPTEMALAMVLLAAAGLKARQLAGHTEASLPGFLHNRMVLAAIVQGELLLCLWLLAGGWRRLRFVCATGCFLLFGTVAMYEALHAMPSCGCFGNVKVPPILTAIFDFVAVAILWLSRPDNADSPQKPPTRMRLAMASVAALATSTALWTGTLSHPPPPSSGEKTLIVLEPATWLNQPFSLLDELDGPSRQP